MAPDMTQEPRVSLLGTRDEQTVDADGQAIRRGIDGVEVQHARAHVDPRVEMVNFDDPFWREPIVYSYSITVNPRRIKGWGMHLRQTDRHHIHCGSARFVLYDSRIDSPTHGNVAVHNFGDEARGAIRIPPGVWHALHNFGDGVVHATNFPTVRYDHASPDKQLLPIDSELIPFDFGDLDTYGR